MKINEGALKIITRKKNATPHFKEHCTKRDDISLVVIHFFFSQTNLVFKSNPVFIDILDSFRYNLFTFLPFVFTFILQILKFIQCLYAFFIKNEKSFDEVRCSFCKAFILKMSLCFIFHEKFLSVNVELLLTAKITPDVNNYLLLLHAVPELRSSLHVRRKF